MVRVCGIGQTLIRTCQEIKVVAMKSVFRHHWMKAFGYQYHIVMPGPYDLVQRPADGLVHRRVAGGVGERRTE